MINQALVTFVFNIINTPALEKNLIEAAEQTLLDVIEYHPKYLAKQNLVPPILTSLVHLIASSKTSAAGALYSFPTSLTSQKDDDDEEDDEDYNPESRQQELAQCCLDSMALNIRPKYFVEPALTICAQV